MLTGELKSQIDRIWNAFWSGGIANPLEVIELANGSCFGALGYIRTISGTCWSATHSTRNS